MSLAAVTTLVDRGLVPDPLVRFGIRRLLGGRLREERRRDPGSPEARLAAWRRAVAGEPIAAHADAANRQHYELPPEFFRRVLGPRLKYSCCLWNPGTETLAAAEEAMLEITAARAGIGDGQRILDLGCGWGSMSLWIAERHPTSRVLAVSNSRSQGEWIRAEAARRGLANVEHRVADVNDLDLPAGSFDRVVSIEMLEHVRAHARLFRRLERWLAPGGSLFVHVFCHRELTYAFEPAGPADWMARHFFTGGVMPSIDLLPAESGPLALEQRWLVPGLHYRRTAEAWLARLDERRVEVLPLLESVHGDEADLWFERWRVFFLACAELFGYRTGTEWLVGHYRFSRRSEIR